MPIFQVLASLLFGPPPSHGTALEARHPLLPPHRHGAAAGGPAVRGRRGGAAGVAVRTGQGGTRNLGCAMTWDDRWSFNVLRIVRDLDVDRMGRWEWDLLFYEYFFVGHRQVCSCLIYAKGNFPVRFAGSLMCHFHWKSLDQGTECCHTWMGKDGKVWSPASVESGGSCDICPSRERMSIGNPGVPHQSPQSLQSAT